MNSWTIVRLFRILISYCFWKRQYTHLQRFFPTLWTSWILSGCILTWIHSLCSCMCLDSSCTLETCRRGSRILVTSFCHSINWSLAFVHLHDTHANRKQVFLLEFVIQKTKLVLKRSRPLDSTCISIWPLFSSCKSCLAKENCWVKFTGGLLTSPGSHLATFRPGCARTQILDPRLEAAAVVPLQMGSSFLILRIIQLVTKPTGVVVVISECR